MNQFITNTYLHLYYTSTTIPHIFHHKHTYIYIYTIHQLRYPISFITNTHIFTFILCINYNTPYLSSQTHIYLHLYYTSTTIPHIFHHKHTLYLHLYYASTIIPHIFHHKHTYIYIYTIPRLRYPISFITSFITHIYLHLYYTSTIPIPHIFHYKHTYIYIYTIHQLRYPISFITNTHIFTFILYINYDTPYLSSQTHIYLHLYYTSTTIPHIFHHKHTYIYIYTIHQLRYPYLSSQTHRSSSS